MARAMSLRSPRRSGAHGYVHTLRQILPLSPQRGTSIVAHQQPRVAAAGFFNLKDG